MKGRRLAIGLVLIGIGLLLGMGISRGFSRVLMIPGNMVGTAVERVVIREDFLDRFEGSRRIRIPSIETIPTVPAPFSPRIDFPERVTVTRHGFPFSTIFGFIGQMIRLASNLFALLLIVIGAFLILRQRNKIVEKSPPKVLE